MSIYEIWSEGYRATGDYGYATYHGSSEGKSLKDACVNFAKVNPSFAKYFDPKRVTYWGCKLFDNEPEARRSFG